MAGPSTIYDLDSNQVKNSNVLTSEATYAPNNCDGTFRQFAIPPFYYHPASFQNGLPVMQSQLPTVTVVDQNTPTPPSQTPPDTAQQVSPFDLKKALDLSVNGNTCAYYEAGKAIATAYHSRLADAGPVLNAFLEKNCRIITNWKHPTFETEPPNSEYFSHGYGIMTMLQSFESKFSLGQKGATSDLQFDAINGGSTNNIRDPFKYPMDNRFTGKEMNKTLLKEMAVPNHVKVKKYLIELLANSCVKPSDIQEVWILPGDHIRNLRKMLPFPEDLYNALRDILMQFFQIDDKGLQGGPYKTEYGELPSLKGFADLSNKKKMYKQLSAARYTFLTFTYHKQLKSALKDLREGKLIQKTPGAPVIFKYRKRYPVDSDDDEEGNDDDDDEIGPKKKTRKVAGKENVPKPVQGTSSDIDDISSAVSVDGKKTKKNFIRKDKISVSKNSEKNMRKENGEESDSDEFS